MFDTFIIVAKICVAVVLIIRCIEILVGIKS